jgi:hypothetical protein
VTSLVDPSGPRRSVVGGSGTPGFNSPSQLDSHRVSTCGVCRRGVYRHEERVWSTGLDGAPVGINHASCVGGVP